MSRTELTSGVGFVAAKANAPSAGGRHPRVGDIVLWEEHQSSPGYSLSAFPGLRQISYPSRAEGLEQGQTYAEQRDVDLWSTLDGCSFMLLQQYRYPT
jgi:hypothetical protein